jgi:hypothetical protein
MKHRSFLMLLILLALDTQNCVHAAKPAITTSINKLFTYGTYDGNNTSFLGDIIIVPNEFPAGCDGGFWIDKDDAKDNPSMLSFALSAFHSESTVRVSVNTEKIWKGSSGVKYCRVRYISLQK